MSRDTNFTTGQISQLYEIELALQKLGQPGLREELQETIVRARDRLTDATHKYDLLLTWIHHGLIRKDDINRMMRMIPPVQDVRIPSRFRCTDVLVHQGFALEFLRKKLEIGLHNGLLSLTSDPADDRMYVMGVAETRTQTRQRVSESPDFAGNWAYRLNLREAMFYYAHQGHYIFTMGPISVQDSANGNFTFCYDDGPQLIHNQPDAAFVDYGVVGVKLTT